MFFYTKSCLFYLFFHTKLRIFICYQYNIRVLFLDFFHMFCKAVTVECGSCMGIGKKRNTEVSYCFVCFYGIIFLPYVMCTIPSCCPVNNRKYNCCDSGIISCQADIRNPLRYLLINFSFYSAKNNRCFLFTPVILYAIILLCL